MRHNKININGQTPRPPVEKGVATPPEAPPPNLITVLQDLATTLRKSLLPTPELVSAKAAARIAGVSTPTWYRLVSAGKTPAPVRLAGSVRWRVTELRAWITAGCPDRKRWEAISIASHK